MTQKLRIIVVLVLLFKAVLSDDCPPCKCQFYYGSEITCSSETVDFFHPLKSVPAIQYPSPVNWDDMFIKNQPLKNLTANAFEKAGLVDLSLLSVTNCEIETVDIDAFKNVSNLNDLDLSFNFISFLHDEQFKHTIYIRYLKLNNNKLTSVNSIIFKKLTKLENLEINNNQLTTFHENALLNNKDLKKLQLISNNLTRLNINVLKTKTKFSILKISENPWICDCLLKDLFTYMLKKFKTDPSNYEKEMTGTYCAAPEYITDDWRKLTEENFNCWIFSRPDKEKVKAQIENTVNLSCIVDSNAQPNITWKIGNENINNPIKKYNLTIKKLHDATYNYTLQINDLSQSDQGKYKCILENSFANKISETEITLTLDNKPINVTFVMIVIGVILFAICVIALFFKCCIKCFVITYSNGDSPKFEEDNTDNISMQSFTRDNFRNIHNNNK